jgi:hypothetical protein
MTKREIRNAINKQVYFFAESLGYQMSDDGDGSCVSFVPEGGNGDDVIDYHRSEHYTVTLNWASDKVKKDARLIDEFVDRVAQRVNYEADLLKPLTYTGGMYCIGDIMDVDGDPWVEKDQAIQIIESIKQNN